MNVLSIDTGGTRVKVLAAGEKTRREFSSGSKLTPKRMFAAVKKLGGNWEYDVVFLRHLRRLGQVTSLELGKL